MVLGVLLFNWWFEYLTSTLLICGIIIIFLLRQGEEKSIKVFMKGVGNFYGVALIIGFARGINITLYKGNINDTILFALSKIVDGLPKVIYIIIMLIIFTLLGFFIASSSILAVLFMSVLPPSGDNVSIGRNVIVNAYMFGQNYIQIISPSDSFINCFIVSWG